MGVAPEHCGRLVGVERSAFLCDESDADSAILWLAGCGGLCLPELYVGVELCRCRVSSR